MNTFVVLNYDEVNELNGGGVGGAVAGGIFGGAAGLCVYTAKACITGEATGNGMWKAYTAGALTGAGIGAWLPV